MVVDRVVCVYEMMKYGGETAYELVRVLAAFDGWDIDKILDKYKSTKYCCVIREIENTLNAREE